MRAVHFKEVDLLNNEEKNTDTVRETGKAIKQTAKGTAKLTGKAIGGTLKIGGFIVGKTVGTVVRPFVGGVIDGMKGKNKDR